MLLRQLFYHPTFGYTYALADMRNQQAALIDPVKARMRDYVQLFNELGITLTTAIDTHTHDDRESALPALRELWNCETIIGAPQQDSRHSRIVRHGETIAVGELTLEVMHTPGHTMDSHSFYLQQPNKTVVFTGDTLLVRTVGLSNQESSSPKFHYHTLLHILAELPPDTIVYPGRDFKGWPLSTIREERAFNPYLLAESLEDFLALKEQQKPAHIRPLTVHHEPEADSESLQPGAPVPATDFYLPGRGLRSLDENSEEDPPPLPSWR